MKKLDYIYQEILSNIEKNKSTIYVSFVFTYIWGLVCHGYMFFNNFFSHDSLNEFNADVYGNVWKIQLGRVLVPYYRKLTSTSLTLPWLIGVFALLWLSITVFLVVKLYNIEKKHLVFLIAGILTTNITVIAMTATYIHELDNNMFGLMLAVVAAYLWRNYKYGFCIGSLFVGAALGIYQSFISVTATLIIISAVLDLLEGKEFSTVFKNGINGIIMLLLGGGVYLLLVKVVCAITNVSLFSGSYNSITNLGQGTIRDYIQYIPGTYQECFERFFKYPAMFPDNLSTICQIILLLILAYVLIQCWFGLGWKEKILTAILIIVMPLGMNTVYILNKGMTHDLMNYAFWFVYLLAILVVSKHGCGIKREAFRLPSIITVLMIAVTLVGNIQVSNTVYMKKNIEHEATLSLFTRILYRIESHEKFSPEETKIVFVGKPVHLMSNISGVEVSKEITGAKIDYLLGAETRDYYAAYFEYVLQYPDIIADEETWIRMQEAEPVFIMPSYPKEGSIYREGDIFIVKIGED